MTDLATAWRPFEPGDPVEKPQRKPVCSTCNDTHRMQLRDGSVMCTACPVPCRVCRDDRRAYCAETPCPCDCHRKDPR
jgi:hypothetical protein